MNRLLLIGLAMIALSAATFRWSVGRADLPADFVFINRGEVNTLDPTNMSWLQDIRVADALWEGLYTLDPQTLRPVLGCAGGVDISDDKKVYTFHIRPEARWSNGEAVTSDDFLFAWKRMLDEGGDYIDLYHYIHGADAYRKAVAAHVRHNFDSVGVKKIDALTLRVTLDDPVTFFPYLCAFPAFFPQNRQSMERFRPDPSRGYDLDFTHPGNLVGNGPYRLDAWQFKRNMRLVASDTYWDRASVKSRVIEILSFSDGRSTFLKYESGGVDWLSDVPAEIAADLLVQKRKDLHVFPGFGTYFYSINCRPNLPDGTPNPLADVRVRRALAMAVDKDPIVKRITRLGEPAATTFIPPGVFADYDSPLGLPYDPEAARALMADAGYAWGRGFPKITILYSVEGDHRFIAQNVCRQWGENLNVDVDLEGIELDSFRQRLHHKDYMIARASWIGDYPDPSTFTDKYRSSSDNNDSDWRSADYDRLCDEAEREPDGHKRMALLAGAEQILCNQVPIIPIYHYVNAYMIRRGVSGIPLDPRAMIMLKSVQRSP